MRRAQLWFKIQFDQRLCDVSVATSPGFKSPYRSARSIIHFAMRALMDPDGFRNSNLTQHIIDLNQWC
jgi:hypothetical protein